MGYFEELYKTKIVADLKNKFGIKNPHCVPKISKIVVSAGFGKDGNDKKFFEGTMNEIALITGRKPCYRKSKRAIAGFNLKEGQNVGTFVTLRGKTMYEFLERLIYLSLPRIHDFKGFSRKSFDKHNNFAFGIKDHLIFTELSYDTIVKNRGLNIMFTIENAKTQDQACELLRGFEFPIK
ncbi:MAG: 50S ribosomal protein L5 [Rickettsiales bacterium]|jgi:large subunit ribosomal protein L5|nr:50S ribosomal protein L5 [Rickettsiales bacterium]